MSIAMEQPFYDDSFLSAYGHSEAAALHDFKFLKQNMNVTFAEPYRSYKAAAATTTTTTAHHHLRAPTGDSDFFHPDAAAAAATAASLKLASPELERLINGNGVITTTPTPGSPYLTGYHHHLHHNSSGSSSVGRGGGVEEQEVFVDGFVKALDEMHKLNQLTGATSAPPNVSLGAGTGGVASVTSGASQVFGDNPIYTTLNSCAPNTNLTPQAASSGHASYPTTTISYLPHHHHHHHPHHPGLPHPHHAAASHYQHQQSVASALPFHHQHPHAALYSQRIVTLKEEPQTVPDLLSSSEGGSPPPSSSSMMMMMSPVDMEDQERVKAERKKLRNRLAATKCRKRKLERISRLEDKVKVLKTDNAGLSSTATLLREQVAQLKRKVMTHVNSGCQLALSAKTESY